MAQRKQHLPAGRRPGKPEQLTSMQWTLGVILLVVIAVMTVIWLGLQHLLLKPLHSVMGHIRAIADGDLTQPISARRPQRDEPTAVACTRCNPRWSEP
jgi:methyl-accepting chemotaxis protein